MTERTIVALPVSSLMPAAINPKRHDLDALRSSLARFGYAEPVMLDERTGRLVAGHGRCDAVATLEAAGGARPDGVTVDADGRWCVPVVRGWASSDDDEAAAYLVASNRLTEVGGWDDAELVALLEQVAEGPGLDGVGYSAEDLTALLSALAPPPPALTDPDSVPPLRDESISQPGSMWLLGPHRVLCGDARDPLSFGLLLAGSDADCVWTDPPYGVDYVGKTRDALKISGDRLDDAALEQLLDDALGNTKSHCRPGAGWWVCGPPGPQSAVFAAVLRRLGTWRQTIVWVKDRFVLGHEDYHYRHENLFMGWTPGAGHQRPPDRRQDTVWQIPRPSASREHPTMKPVALIDRALMNCTEPGALVLDPFGGSGSTLIACHGLDRVAALIEIDPHYCDVICRRYQQHTGTLPILEASGDAVDFNTEVG